MARGGVRSGTAPGHGIFPGVPVICSADDGPASDRAIRRPPAQPNPSTEEAIMKTVLSVTLLLALLTLAAAPALAHCEIPCGIYGDKLRVQLLEEHILTVEKSMQQIAELSAAPGDKNYHQLVRWIDNKEQHADEIQEIVSQYFLTQRVKPADVADQAKSDLYLRQLTLLHQMLIEAMKAKQGTDLKTVESLRQLLADFNKAYFGEEEKAHSH
jgi:nickel superoxide dismutase